MYMYVHIRKPALGDGAARLAGRLAGAPRRDRPQAVVLEAGRGMGGPAQAGVVPQDLHTDRCYAASAVNIRYEVSMLSSIR